MIKSTANAIDNIKRNEKRKLIYSETRFTMQSPSDPLAEIVHSNAWFGESDVNRNIQMAC